MSPRSHVPEVLELVALRFPTPIADAVHRLSAWENPNQRRDRVVEAFRAVLLLHTSMAMAARHHVPVDTPDPPDTARLFGRLRAGHLTDGDRFLFLKSLLRPWAEQPDCHPTPELVRALFGPRATRRRTEETFNRLLSMRRKETVAHGSTGTEAEAAAIAEDRQSDLADLLATLMPLWEGLRLVYPLGRPESLEESQAGWVLRGVTHHDGRWARASLAPGARLLESQAALVDTSGHPVLRLHPIVLVRKPSGDRPEEVYALDGNDRDRGARYVALPVGRAWHAGDVWRELGATFDPAAPEERPIDAAAEAPYPGLRPFERRDASLFFGRRALTSRVVDLIERKPVVVVAGPSGAGKSSLIHAGVVPALGRRLVVAMRPGHSPVATLRAQLAEVTGENEGDTARGALVHAASVQRMDGVLLVVDQAEELFTLSAGEDEALTFLRIVASLAGSADTPIRALLGVREDYLGRLRRAAGLDGEHVGQVLVGAIGPETLPLALTGPLGAFGFAYEDPAIPREMAAACAEPGALPLLQFAAARLWEKRDEERRLLTRASYEAVGGVLGALSSYADSVVAALSPAQQAAARQMLVRLVTRDGTRDVVPVADLESTGAARDVRFLVEHLCAARLLTRREGSDGRPVVEVALEALIAYWPRLRSWLQEDLEQSLVQRRVREAARHWKDAGRRKDLLLQEGRPLAEAREVRGATTDDSVVAGFIRASLRRARARRGARLALGVIVISLLTTAAWLSTSLWREQARAEDATRGRERAVEQQRAAEEARSAADRKARAQGHLARSAELLDIDPAVALRLALAAAEDDPGPVAAGAVREAFHRDREVCRLPLLDGTVGKGSFSPGGETFVLPGPDGARLFGLDCQELRRLGSGRVQAVAFDPRGYWVAIAGEAGVTLWRPDGTESRAVSTSPADTVVFDFDGRRLAASRHEETHVWESDGSPAFAAGGSASRFTDHGLVLGSTPHRLVDESGSPVPWLGDDGFSVLASTRDAVASWPMMGGGGRVVRSSGEQLAVLDGGGVTAALIEPTYGWSERSWVIAGTRDGGIRVHDATGKLLRAEQAHAGAVTFLAEEAGLLASGSDDGRVRLWSHWDLRDEGRLRPLAVLNAQSPLTGLAIHPQLRVVLTSGSDHMARVWTVVPDEAAPLEASAVSSDGAIVATEREMTLVRVLTLDGEGRAELALPHDIYDAALHGGDQLLATGYWDGDHRKVIVDAGGAIRELPRASRATHCAAASPVGRRVVTGGSDGVARVMDGDGGLLHTLRGHEGAVTEAAFSPDGRLLATGGQDGSVRLWSDAGEAVATARAHQGRVGTLTWAPDGESLVTLGEDRSIRAWGRSGEEQWALTELDDEAWGPVAFSADGRLFATTSEKNDVRVWSRDGRPVTRLEGHTERVWAISFSLDARQVASADMDDTSRVWTLEGGGARTIERAPFAAFTSQGLLTVELDEQGSATMSLDGRPRETLGRGVKRVLLDGERLIALRGVTRVTVSAASGAERGHVDVPGTSPDVFAVSPAGRQVAVREWHGDDRRTITLFTLETGARWDLETGDDTWPDLSFSPDGELLLVSGKLGDERVTKLWTSAGKELATHEGYVWSDAFTPGSDRLALGTSHGVRVLGADGAELETLLGDGSSYGESVDAVAWSPDASSLAAGLRDGSVVVFDRDRAATSLPGPDVEIEEVAFSPSGDVIAAGNEAGDLLIWRTDGQPLASAKAHDGQVLALTFTPSGDIVTSGEDGTIRAFSARGSPLWTLSGEPSRSYELRVTPDERWLLARGSPWRHLHLRDSELLAAARSATPLPLTRAQARLIER